MSCSNPASSARSCDLVDTWRASTAETAASRALRIQARRMTPSSIRDDVTNIERTVCAMIRFRVVSMPMRTMACSISVIREAPE